MAQGSRGVARVLSKLKSSVEEGKYYEAHQMYRTLYFRYCSQEKYIEVLDLLYDGASLLLAHDQQNCGADLALLMLEVLEKSKADRTEHHIGRIAKLFSLLNGNIPERHQYLVRSVKWSSTDENKQGHPLLHQLLAQSLWKEKNYSSARYHFLRSEDGCGCGHMLVELHLLRGYSSEVDLFLAQAVLQYLCLQKKVAASDVFETYTKKHPNITKQSGPPFLLPLLNFLWLLLTAIESGKGTFFTILCEHYQPSLKRDPAYREYLDRIGQLFFDLPPPRPQQQPGGFFGNLLQGLFGGLDDDSDEEDITTAESSRKNMVTEELD
ncbi:Golgi to ER traffic protein 4 homolog [Oratosquilla oratoria]|uniref:Golgi to ER traffic protein 4 homolog n=1 Tax=Oratosquilla oratoria TaxID=337810 RepID=UPI003F763B73